MLLSPLCLPISPRGQPGMGIENPSEMARVLEAQLGNKALEQAKAPLAGLGYR